MPKKHAPAYAKTKPTYVHPSLQSSRASTSSTPPPAQTVNDRIAQLRREQAPRATPEQRDEIASAVNRTVPPELRRILHIPEVNAPKPKPGVMRRRAMGGARPPPGPAAPHSWLRTSRHAPSYLRTLKDSSDSHPSSRFGILATVTADEFQRFPPPRSLQHYCLRTFAIHWEELSEYEQHYIPTLPVALKEALLSYLTLYGSKGCLDFKSLKILFQNDGESTAGWDEVRFLDLTELFGDHFSIIDVGKCLKRQTLPVIDTIERLSLGNHNSQPATGDAPGAKERASVGEDVIESWEDEADQETAPSLPAQLKTPLFRNLSRLSLAHPGKAASWADLLKISPHLNKITHLSLAHWPRPTTTPNAVTASISTRYGSVVASGTPFYSDLDDDWHEATNILRRLSVNTYSLEWLDLEGCNWLRALTWQPESSQTRLGTEVSSSGDVTWSLQVSAPGPDWNDAWRRITYLNVFQGWIPASSEALRRMPAGMVAIQLMRWLRETCDDESVQWKLNSLETGHAVAEWVTKEKVARSIAADIHASRKSKEGVWCRVDYGWGGS